MAVEEGRGLVDIATLGVRIENGQIVATDQALARLTGTAGKTESAFTRLQSVAAKVGIAFGTIQAVRWGTETLLLGARYETLGVVMDVVGRNAGRTRLQMDEFQRSLQQTGISSIGARESLARMAGAQLDMRRASELARVAQNAAVIANVNSTEAFETLIQGITTGMPRVLRSLGIFVDFQAGQEKLARSLRVTADELTAGEKIQANMNTVLERGGQIAGAYEAAMGTAGKQLKSTIRYMEDFREKASQAFQPAFTSLVFAYANALKFLGEHAPAISATAQAVLYVAAGVVALKVAMVGLAAAGGLTLFGGMATSIIFATSATAALTAAMPLLAAALGAVALAMGPLLLVGAGLWLFSRLLQDNATNARLAQQEIDGLAQQMRALQEIHYRGARYDFYKSMGFADREAMLRAIADARRFYTDVMGGAPAGSGSRPPVPTWQNDAGELAKVRVATMAAMAAARETKAAAAATALWREAQEGLTRAHQNAKKAIDSQIETLRMQREEMNANTEAALKLIRAQEAMEKIPNATTGDKTMPSGGLLGGLGSQLAPQLASMASVAGLVGFMATTIGGVVRGLLGATSRVSEAAERVGLALRDFAHNMKVFGLSAADRRPEAQAERAIHDEADQLREQARVTGLATHQSAVGYLITLALIATHEAWRIEQLRAEAAILRQQRLEDLAVRLLRAQGRDAEADAMAFALQQQREYADAVKAGADATERATLLEVQRAEAIKFAADRIKATIAGLTTTIDTLQEFTASLRLGPLTTLSPVQQLAEARRQYEAVLAQAQGGDQTAAGRLPEVARAFLAASRAVNASGGRYAADFTRVLADTDAIAKIFIDQRSVQQRMLDELMAINANTSVFLKPPKPGEPGTPGFPVIPPIDGKLPKTPADDPIIVELQQQIAVLTAGFTEAIDELQALRASVEDGTRKTGLVLEGLKL